MSIEIDPKKFLAELKDKQEAEKRLIDKSAQLSVNLDRIQRGMNVTVLTKNGDIHTGGVFISSNILGVMFASTAERKAFRIEVEDIECVEVHSRKNDRCDWAQGMTAGEVLGIY